jgi:hypothetical protein
MRNARHKTILVGDSGYCWPAAAGRQEEAPCLSAVGHLLTACKDLVTSWDPATGKAIFEIDAAFKTWTLAPGRGWLLATTPGGNLDFFDTATGKPLGRIPGLEPKPNFSISPDGKTLIRPDDSVPTEPAGGVAGVRREGRRQLRRAPAQGDLARREETIAALIRRRRREPEVA